MRYAGVVVTYNRKVLLQECVDALLQQTRPLDTIIVIDNASTDGTPELFAPGGKYAGEKQIDLQRKDKNLGGAGGFYEGVKHAYLQGYDWIWVMDDDTIPQRDALEKLIDASGSIPGEISFLASEVFAEHGEVMNVPSIDISKGENGYPEWGQYLSRGIVRITDATFVSIMINRKGIDKVGLPYAPFFIWGDDKEFTLRLTRHFAPGYAVGGSVAIHKRKVVKNITIEFEDDPRRIGQYYYNYRNNLINCSAYKKGAWSVFRKILDYEALCLRILRGSGKNKWKKVCVIHKGIFGYLSGSYDRKRFRNRFRIDAQ